MAAYKFIHHFTRAGVWQLAPVDRDGHHHKAAAEDLRSRICFAGGPSHVKLALRVSEGALMKKTQITEVHDFAKFMETNPGAIVMFIQDSKGLRPAAVDLEKVPAGTTVHALVPPAENRA
jgi:hypothetical protein